MKIFQKIMAGLRAGFEWYTKGFESTLLPDQNILGENNEPGIVSVIEDGFGYVLVTQKTKEGKQFTTRVASSPTYIPPSGF